MIDDFYRHRTAPDAAAAGGLAGSNSKSAVTTLADLQFKIKLMRSTFVPIVCSLFPRRSAEIGLMTAITITQALAMDFLLLPTLLIRMDGGARGVAHTDAGAASGASAGLACGGSRK